MSNNARNVVVGRPAISGGAFAAPAGTAAPTGLATVLPAAFKQVGYVDTSGVVQKIKTSVTDIVAWGGSVVRKVQTQQDVTYSVTMIETNATSQGLYYGFDHVVVTPATVASGELIAIQLTGDEPDHSVWVFEIVDGARTGRMVLPDAQISSRDDVSFIDKDSVSYGLELTVFPDATDVKAYIYWDDGVFAAA